MGDVDIKISKDFFEQVMALPALQEAVDQAAEELAIKAESMSGRNFVAVRSKHSKRPAAAVLPDDVHASNSDNKHNWLRKSLGG